MIKGWYQLECEIQFVIVVNNNEYISESFILCHNISGCKK